MWASSRMRPLGFRISLIRTAAKEDCIEVQFSRLKSHRVLVNKYCAIVERVAVKHPPPSQKGEFVLYVDFTGVCC